MDCVPHLMYQNVRLDVLNIQPGHPTDLTCAYRISETGEHMLIKEWKKNWTFVRRFLEATLSERQELETG